MSVNRRWHRWDVAIQPVGCFVISLTFAALIVLAAVLS
jgi:hypothetical protein